MTAGVHLELVYCVTVSAHVLRRGVLEDKAGDTFISDDTKDHRQANERS